MTNFNFTGINFDKYDQLAQRLISNANGIVLFDAEFQTVWGDESIAHCVSSNVLNNINQPREAGSFQIDNHRLYYAPIVDGKNLYLGLLCLSITEDRASIVLGKGSIIREGFSIIAACICDEVQANSELNVMAQELADRYDELNLLYDSSGDGCQFSKGKEGLKTLVVNCFDYMDVDVVALLLPEKKITHLKYRSHKKDGVSELLDQLLSSVYPWIFENDQTVVINCSTETLAGELIPGISCKLLCSPIHDGNGDVCGIMALFNDVDKADFRNSDCNLLGVLALKAAKIFLATYDQLTGLLTRNSFGLVLDDLVENNSDLVEHCLVCIDIEQLSVVNEVHGLQVGDDLIKTVGKLLEKELRNGDFVARLSGDVFGILLSACIPIQAKQVAINLQKKINEMVFVVEEERIDVYVRISIIPVAMPTTRKALLTSADVALDIVKQKGRNRVEIYSQSDDEIHVRQSQIKLIHLMQDALRNDQFKLYCQGIFECEESTKAHHYEVLLRWEDTSGSIISPGDFLPAAEFYKLMPDIDRWVIKKTIDLLSDYSLELENNSLSWAVNLSGQTISDPEFREYLIGLIQVSPIPNHSLGFEITESSAIDCLVEAQNLIDSLKKLGCKVYLDDFGTGLSSFSYLQKMSFDYVKIDGCFIRDIRQNPVSEAMVRAISDVAKAMGIGVVAEFVESKDDIAYIRDLGVDLLQGFALHKPEDMSSIIKKINVGGQNHVAQLNT